MYSWTTSSPARLPVFATSTAIRAGWFAAMVGVSTRGAEMLKLV